MDQSGGEAVADVPATNERVRRQHSDPRLLAAARRGSAEALEALIARHWELAHRIAYGIIGDAHVAEDVTQEAMLSVVAGIGRFDVLRPVEPWLHRVVSNRALDWVRSSGRRPEVSLESAGGTIAVAATNGSDPALLTALAELPPDHRAVIALRYVGGYGPGEIAKMLGIPRGTVGSRLRRALDQLRNALEEDHG